MEHCYFSISTASWLHKERGVFITIRPPDALQCPHHDKPFVQEAVRIVVDMKSKHSPELSSCILLVVEDMWAEMTGNTPVVQDFVRVTVPEF